MSRDDNSRDACLIAAASNDDANAPSKTARGGCPICGKPRVQEYRPFCSKRCADIDLGRWLKGAYVVPGNADADEDGDTPSLPDTGRPANTDE